MSLSTLIGELGVVPLIAKVHIDEHVHVADNNVRNRTLCVRNNIKRRVQ